MINLEKIKEWLKDNDLNQSDLALILGCSRQTVNYKLKGKRKFDLGDIKRIAEASGKKITYFLS